MIEKVCRVCGETKDIAEFPKDRSKRTGYASLCKVCNRAACKRAYWQNIEIYKTRNKAWREKNSEACYAQRRKWYAAHTEEMRAYQREYYLTNKDAILQDRKDNANRNNARRRKTYQKDSEKAAAFASNRRARITNNGGSFTVQEWAALKTEFDNQCLCCKIAEPEIHLTVDHIIPISEGGTSDIDNIQPLCKVCNSSKGTRTIDYRGIFK